jgi:hypothetical protein
MSYLEPILGPSIKVCREKITPELEALAREVPTSKDELELSENTERKAKLRTLESLSPPTMGKIERFMSKIRGTEDIVPYPGNVKLNNFAKVDDTVYRGAMPESGAEFQKLKEVYGVKHIIDLRGFETTKPKYIEDFGKGWAKFHGIEYHHMSMSSHKAPTEKELTDIFNIIEKAKAKGEKVYIHCKHGIDRTGAVAAAYEAKLGRPQNGIYEHFRKHGYNFIHRLTRPVQRDFVQGADLQKRVNAAEAHLPGKKPCE